MGNSRQYVIVSLRRWLLPVLVSIALALSTFAPLVSAIETRYFGCDHSQVIDARHSQPGHHQPLSQKASPLCNPAAGCFTFTLVEESVATFAPMVSPVRPGAVVKLAARTIAPPLPPPISIIIA